VRAASAARTVERGKNPEDGTGGGLATLTLPAPASRPGWVERGTRRSCAQGSKNSTRGDPELGRHAVVAQATITGPKRGQPRRSSALKGTRTPREDLPGLWFRESGRTGKTPRPSRTARGERWKPQKALPGRQHKPLKGKRTPREPGRARVTVLVRCDEAVSLWRGRRQEPQRAVTRKGDGGRARSGSEFGHRDEHDSRDLPDGESRPDGRAKDTER